MQSVMRKTAALDWFWHRMIKMSILLKKIARKSWQKSQNKQ